MATAKEIIAKAVSQLGYKEGTNNDNKYGAAYGLNHQPWCVIFVWWCFREAGASALFYGGGKTASCTTLNGYHKKQGQAVAKSKLQPGDIVFFNFSGGKSTDHVGIVETGGSSSITTIEGNTSSGSGGSQANGDGVYRRKRALKYVVAAYRPAYITAKDYGWSKENFVREVQSRVGASVDGICGAETLSKCPLLKAAPVTAHSVVPALQARLVVLGCLSAENTIDGEYGANTAAAVAAYQSANGLGPDGECGQATWKSLLT